MIYRKNKGALDAESSVSDTLLEEHTPKQLTFYGDCGNFEPNEAGMTSVRPSTTLITALPIVQCAMHVVKGATGQLIVGVLISTESKEDPHH